MKGEREGKAREVGCEREQGKGKVRSHFFQRPGAKTEETRLTSALGVIQEERERRLWDNRDY